ncbi:hypothetical protein [Dissulfurispira thermophila]|nr:hypothetical protein [Dissulfurispira thermophila]
MAADEGIREPYRILGIRGIGIPHVFPKTRIVRQSKKTTKEKKELPRNTEEKIEKTIDIEA